MTRNSAALLYADNIDRLLGVVLAGGAKYADDG
jgi:hypothetical protein